MSYSCNLSWSKNFRQGGIGAAQKSTPVAINFYHPTSQNYAHVLHNKVDMNVDIDAIAEFIEF
jgi:hypothetical protein